MTNQGSIDCYCVSQDCKSKKKVIKNLEDIMNDHSHHLPDFQTLTKIRQQLRAENHPLSTAKVHSFNEDICSFVDQEIENLMEAFAFVANDLKQICKAYVNSNLVSLEKLIELFNAIIEKNDGKIKELQFLLPKLYISAEDIINQEIKGELVHEKIVQIFKEINQKLQSLKNFTFKNEGDYHWSTANRNKDTQIDGATITSYTGVQNLNLIEPCLMMTEVTKVKLQVQNPSNLLLCDLNNADYSRGNDDGSYSHDHKRQIYWHYLAPKKSNVRGFKFEVGDILELEWNGPMKQFITHKPSTQEKYIQNVQFDKNAVLHFGIQLYTSGVKIIS